MTGWGGDITVVGDDVFMFGERVAIINLPDGTLRHRFETFLREAANEDVFNPIRKDFVNLLCEKICTAVECAIDDVRKYDRVRTVVSDVVAECIDGAMN